MQFVCSGRRRRRRAVSQSLLRLLRIRPKRWLVCDRRRRRRKNRIKVERTTFQRINFIQPISRGNDLRFAVYLQKRSELWTFTSVARVENKIKAMIVLARWPALAMSILYLAFTKFTLVPVPRASERKFVRFRGEKSLNATSKSTKARRKTCLLWKYQQHNHLRFNYTARRH